MKNESIKGASDGNYTLFIMGQDNEYTPLSKKRLSEVIKIDRD